MISNTHKPASAWTDPLHSHSPSSSPESHSRPIPRMTSPSASIHVPHDHLLQPSQLHHTSSRTSISSARRPDPHPLTSPSNLEIPMMPHVQVTPTSTPSAQERSSISFNAKPHGRKRTSSIPEDTPQLSPAPHQKGSFEFRFNDPAANAQRGFINNSIRTSKYNILTFLPVNLFEQFRRLANAYFLIIVIIQSIPAVSPFPVWTSLAPLCFILGVSATKEALEDYRRHKADNIANNRLYQVVIESTPEKDTHHTHMTREQQLAKHASLSQVDSSAVLRTVASKDITVGSILKITKDQEFPADCVLLSTSRADSTCYVNTAALDGEAVPKVRVAPPSTLMYQNARQLSYLRGSIMCEPPNSALYHFQGRLTLEQSIELNELVKVQEEQAASAGMNAEDAAKYAQWQKRKDRAKNDVDTTRVSALGDQQLLLRGSKLANTEWCYCVVAYTGVVTKMMLNRNPARFKFSRFESILNRMVLIMFIFNLLCCILLAVVYSKRDYEFVNWLDHYYPTDRDDPLIDSPALGWIKNFATQYILFSFMIPMSLYVTIELVKVGQAQFMEWDSRMSYTEEDGVTHKMQVKASSLNEELGMVDYIFSDKTGTLTCNRMELSRCSINGLLYKEIRPIDKMSQPNTPEMPGKKLSTATSTGTIGCTVHEEPLQQSPLQTAHHLPTSSMDGVRRASIELASFSKHDASPILTTTATSSQHSDHENDRDVKLMADVVRAAFSGYGDQNDAHSDPAREFLLNILVNNSVLPSIRPRPAHHKHSSTLRHKQDDHKDDIDWMFQSQSPDEIALMEALYRSGVFLMERTGNHLTIRCQIPGQAVRDIEIEIVAILEFTSTRARMSVVTRMSDGRYMLYVKGADSTVIKLVDQSTSATSQLAEKTLRHTTEFAGTGSRTLLMAGKEIPQAHAITWLQTYQDAITSLDNREHKVESAFAQLEHHCMLLGCSAVDDQLQEYVPETIELLLNAGLKVIVLTGDKLETAVTIARQSRLVQPHMHLLHIKGNTPETCTESLQTTLHHVTQIKSNYHHAKQEAEFAMAIEGACLEMCLTHCQTIFLQLFLICHTVISYRSTPMQKALAVRLVKKSLNQTCLAIGDGANDVSMIQEAHVGVGIMGKEGSHAAMSSDFVLRRFHHLTYLLFLHGRYSFYRTAMVVYFSFYKNMVFPFPQFWFSFFSLNTGQTLYIALLISAFNLFLTSLPPIVVGVMEKDVHDSFLLCNPLAYKAFKEQCVFKVTKFLKWLIRGVWHGLVFYFVAHFIFSRQDVIFPSGQIEGIWFMGILILMTLCFTVNIQMTIATKYITIYNILAAILGMIAFVLILAILSSSYWVTLAPDAYQLLQHLFETHIFWSYALLSFVICMFPILVINSLSSSFPSTMSEQLRIFSKQSHPVHRHGSELVSVVPATSETEKRRYL